MSPMRRECGPARRKLRDGWRRYWEIAEDQLGAVVLQPEESVGLCAVMGKQK